MGESPAPRITWAETSAAACSGAVLTSIFITPLDVVKVRMQHPGRGAAACKCCSSATSTRSIMLRVARHEGLGSLWSGLQPALIMSVPGTVLYFATYEHVRDMCTSLSPQYAPLLAGGGARILTATIVSPVELMRTRMQAEASLMREGMLGGARSLVRREGWASLFKGLSPTLWRDVPFSCIYWMGYENLKRRALASSSVDCDSNLVVPAISFICGAASGTVAALLTTPFDVLKTRRQVSDHAHEIRHGASSVSGAPRSAVGTVGTMTALVQIAQKEGVGALFAGVGPRLAKVAPSCAIMIASYELGKAFFRRRASERSAS
jgi:solute carrier family 25 protein 39/40